MENREHQIGLFTGFTQGVVASVVGAATVLCITASVNGLRRAFTKNTATIELLPKMSKIIAGTAAGLMFATSYMSARKKHRETDFETNVDSTMADAEAKYDATDDPRAKEKIMNDFKANLEKKVHTALHDGSNNAVANLGTKYQDQLAAEREQPSTHELA